MAIYPPAYKGIAFAWRDVIVHTMIDGSENVALPEHPRSMLNVEIRLGVADHSSTRAVPHVKLTSSARRIMVMWC